MENARTASGRAAPVGGWVRSCAKQRVCAAQSILARLQLSGEWIEWRAERTSACASAHVGGNPGMTGTEYRVSCARYAAFSSNQSSPGPRPRAVEEVRSNSQDTSRPAGPEIEVAAARA